MIKKGSKIKLVKTMGVFNNIGEVCEVVDVAEDGAIAFKFGESHLGVMSEDEFEKYFVEVEDPLKISLCEYFDEKINGIQIMIDYLIDDIEQNNIEYYEICDRLMEIKDEIF